MKPFTDEIRLKLHHSSVKWSDLFDDEKDLIEHMLLCKVTGNYPVMGYGYITSFQKQIAEGKELSKKQITQLKRLARAIYLHLHGIYSR